MIEVNGLKLASTIGVLFALKQSHGCKTLQETYKILESTEMDNMFDVLCVAYNKANNTTLSIDEFANKLEESGIGFVKVTETYQKLIEDIMFSGLTPEEIEQRKNQMMNLKK